jgi:hypothetical protein
MFFDPQSSRLFVKGEEFLSRILVNLFSSFAAGKAVQTFLYINHPNKIRRE